MPVTCGKHARITQSEYDALQAAAEANGQGHWMPANVEGEMDLLQAQASAEGTLLLDMMFGDVVDGEHSARDALERGEIPLERVVGVSREKLEKMIDLKASGPAEGSANTDDNPRAT